MDKAKTNFDIANKPNLDNLKFDPEINMYRVNRYSW